MRHKTLTKAQKDMLHNAKMLKFALQDKIYAAGNGSMTFSECRALISPTLEAEYIKAEHDLFLLECDLVDTGRAYRDALGRLRPTRVAP